MSLREYLRITAYHIPGTCCATLIAKDKQEKVGKITKYGKYFSIRKKILRPFLSSDCFVDNKAVVPTRAHLRTANNITRCNLNSTFLDSTFLDLLIFGLQ